MDTDLIFQFRAVFENGTLAKAAEQLHQTPGALSRAMKRLEHQLGSKLFVAAGRNIRPTREGVQFFAASAQIISAIENAKQALKDQPEVAPALRLVTFEVFSTHFVAWMLNQWSKTGQASVPVVVNEATPGQLEKVILRGGADFGLTYIPYPHPDLDHVPIRDMPLGVFATSALRQNDGVPFAVPITELGMNVIQARSLDGWPMDAPREIQYRFEMLETALDLASRGLCKLVCPKFVVAIENERLLPAYRLSEVQSKIKLPKLKVYAVKKKNDPESQYFRELCKAVRIGLAS